MLINPPNQVASTPPKRVDPEREKTQVEIEYNLQPVSPREYDYIVMVKLLEQHHLDLGTNHRVMASLKGFALSRLDRQLIT